MKIGDRVRFVNCDGWRQHGDIPWRDRVGVIAYDLAGSRDFRWDVQIEDGSLLPVGEGEAEKINDPRTQP